MSRSAVRAAVLFLSSPGLPADCRPRQIPDFVVTVNPSIVTHHSGRHGITYRSYRRQRAAQFRI